MKTAKEIWPEGRRLYYEGDNPREFIDAMLNLGLKPQIELDVPADLLDKVRNEWPMGS